MSREEQQKLNLEALLKDVGEFGAYQRRVCFLLCALISLSGSMNFLFTFGNAVPPSRCIVPSCDSPNDPQYTDAVSKGFKSFAYPEEGASSSCSVYRNDTPLCDPSSFASKERSNCSRWVYDTSVLGRNYISDFDLVCSKKPKGPLILSAFFGGQMLGLLPIGALADRFGRKVIFILSSSSLAVIGCLQSIFASTYESVFIFTLLSGLLQSGFFQLGYILGIEIVGKSKRLLCGSAIQICFVLGELYLSLCAWIFRDWRKLILSFSLPCLMSIGYTAFIPESPRWLLSKGRTSEFERLMGKIARTNGVPTPRFQEYLMDASESNVVPEEGLLSFIQSRVLMIRLCILSFGWFVIGMSYYGLSLNASSLVGSIYLNFCVLSLVEIPGYSLSYVLMRSSGRRIAMVGSLLTAGVVLLLSGLFDLPPWLKTLLYLVSKMSITCAFASIYLYTSELLPTSLRTGCVSLASLMGKSGSLVSPYVSLLTPVLGSESILIVLGAAPTLCGLLFLCLPETLGCGLPNDIKEAELIGKGAYHFGGEYLDDDDSNEVEPLLDEDERHNELC